MGADLRVIHEAVAEQIKAGISRDWNVAAFPYSGMTLPLIEVWPGGGEYIKYFETFGSSGKADVSLNIRIKADASNPETTFIQITDMLSAGTGHGSSIVDALMTDTTLGGAVHTLMVHPPVWAPNDENFGTEAFVPVEIVLSKSGAVV